MRPVLAAALVLAFAAPALAGEPNIFDYLIPRGEGPAPVTREVPPDHAAAMEQLNDLAFRHHRCMVGVLSKSDDGRTPADVLVARALISCRSDLKPICGTNECADAVDNLLQPGYELAVIAIRL